MRVVVLELGTVDHRRVMNRKIFRTQMIQYEDHYRFTLCTLVLFLFTGQRGRGSRSGVPKVKATWETCLFKKNGRGVGGDKVDKAAEAWGSGASKNSESDRSRLL